MALQGYALPTVYPPLTFTAQPVTTVVTDSGLLGIVVDSTVLQAVYVVKIV